jgi:hypothetical protein
MQYAASCENATLCGGFVYSGLARSFPKKMLDRDYRACYDLISNTYMFNMFLFVADGIGTPRRVSRRREERNTWRERGA